MLTHNKTLTAQLANKFHKLMPNNSVKYFISYYNYYQPKTYMPQTNTFIEKNNSINAKVKQLHHSTTNSLLNHRNIIIVSTVSYIYNLSTAKKYLSTIMSLQIGNHISHNKLMHSFLTIQYNHNNIDFNHDKFHVHGNTIKIIPIYKEHAIHIKMFDDKIKALYSLHPLTNDILRQLNTMSIFPATHYTASPKAIHRTITSIKVKLAKQLELFKKQNKLLETQQLQMHTTFNLKIIKQINFYNNIKNYSHHIDSRQPSKTPNTLLNYFPNNFLIVINKSHVTMPQIRTIYKKNTSHKRTLIEHSFHLPSTINNHPLH